MNAVRQEFWMLLGVLTVMMFGGEPVEKTAEPPPHGPGQTGNEAAEILCRILTAIREECEACREARKRTGHPVQHIRACTTTWLEVEVLRVLCGNVNDTRMRLRLGPKSIDEPKAGEQGIATLIRDHHRVQAREHPWMCVAFRPRAHTEQPMGARL